MASSRTSRSDEGILALTDSVFKDIFGLEPETVDRIKKIIRNQGQWQDLKIAVRTMSGVAHRRLNDVINMAQQRRTDSVDSDEYDGDEHGDNDNEEFMGANDRPEFGAQERDYESDRGMRENLTFTNYLLAELQYSDQDLRDPAKKQDIMRLMRAGDGQAQQLVNRGEREQKRERRLEVTQETDPRRASLRRRKLSLQKQMLKLDKELGEEPTEDETSL